MTKYFHFIIVGMAAGVVWEFLGPIINKKSVFDPVDFICYFIGINLFYGTITILKRHNTPLMFNNSI